MCLLKFATSPLCRVRLAAARVQAGAVDGATEAAEEVLDTIAAGLDSWRVSLELGRVMESLEAYPGRPASHRSRSATPL
jgi:hypothetical protein